MKYTEDQHKQDKSDMLGEFNRAIAEAEELRKAESKAAEDGSAATAGTPEGNSAGTAPGATPLQAA
jgi:hypothetical protein